MNKKLEQFLVSRRAVLQGGAALGASSLLGSRAFAAPSTPISFIGWQFQPQMVEENVATFQKLNDERVTYELVSGDYHPIAETKLIGGQQIDMLYAEEDRIARWNAAGWTRDLEGLEGVDAIKAGLYPASLTSLSLPDGRFAGMPYYAGHMAFVFNEEAVSKAGLEVPTSYEGLLEACRKLKADGISAAPFNGAWGQKWPELSWSLFGAWYAEGAKVFDEESNFVDDQALRTVLEFYRSLYSEGLVVEDIMTLPNEGVPSFASGRHVFQFMHDYNQSVANDPKLSQIAGKVQNALMPGATKSTFAWTACYLMGAHPVDVNRVWKMLQFFGGKADDGQYHVSKKWALEFGLGSAHKELMADPDVVASFSKWRNLDVTNEQISRARPRTVSKEIWFPEWDLFMMQRVQDYIRGTGDTDQIVSLLADQVTSLKEKY
ncbi:ABC transporter substrate-binding protein [Kaistia adipata]|uniref:ABC transporter substrate-binding protein n=1 Tax=Kaistia adipata TaxID=166954 RepID=UPI0004904270|nr:ABC transporter substrate-binding protein [Kaistia adipata]